MNSSSSNTLRRTPSNPELLHSRYRMRNRRQIGATSLPPIEERHRFSHRPEVSRIPRPKFRGGGAVPVPRPAGTSASRPVEVEQPIASRPVATYPFFNRRSAPVRERPIFTELMSEETLVEDPAPPPSKKVKTVHSKISALGRSKSVKDLFSSATAFALREKPASDVNDEHTSQNEQLPAGENQNSTPLVQRLKTRFERAGGRLRQALGTKEKESKETPSQAIERNFNTWQGFNRAYPTQSAFTDSFMHTTEVLLDETLQNHQSSRTQQEELAPALPRISKRPWSNLEGISPGSTQNLVDRNRVITSRSGPPYHTVR